MRITELRLRHLIREELIRRLDEMDANDDTILGTPRFGRYDFIGREPSTRMPKPDTRIYDSGEQPYNVDLRPKPLPAAAEVRGETPEGYSLTGTGAKTNALIYHIVGNLKELSSPDSGDVSNPTVDDVYSLLTRRKVISRHIEDGASGVRQTGDPDFQEAMMSWKEYFLTDPNNADIAARRAIYDALVRLTSTGIAAMIPGSSGWQSDRFHSTPPKKLTQAEMEDNIRKVFASRKRIK
jgi:hypothetical protein